MVLTDPLHRKLEIKKIPKRIVSLVPSITKTLYDMGLDNCVVGITRFCKYPANWKKEKTIVGGTKDVKIDRIKTLQPDIILANKEENNKENILQLEKIAPVYVSDVKDLCSNNLFLKDLATILSKEKETLSIIQQIEQLRAGNTKKRNLKTVYFIWKDPWMTVGGDTFIHQMMKEAGWDNIFKNKTRYPVVDLLALQELSPDLILLSSEPFPFKEKHKLELQKLFPKSKIERVNGEAFTWFGSYPLEGLHYINQLNY